MNFITRSPWFRRILIAPVAVIPIAAVACSSNMVTDSTAIPAATASPATSGALPAETVIEFTPDGFVPAQVEAPEGSRVILRNATDETMTFVVQGREDGASEDEISVEPGESVDIGLDRVGAYILTLTDDPLVTAGVFIS
jgi:hypothetical protein